MDVGATSTLMCDRTCARLRSDAPRTGDDETGHET